ncbi:nitrate reductase molybdenum cofactor assembly chaperone [Paenibacillus massiliensis]|uniref:nitrate reductase molybdenum cofactor assembly chaperone n=1 Tax=Paenibacillus massiliensis TaxID=225917 RepID=UPI000472C0BC|nr:nitrate reductase molybdenum cofactor assembly chaperone [Paenibacillus massiliensis]
MIDLDLLYQYKPVLAFFSRQLMYPEAQDFLGDLPEEAVAADHPAADHIKAYAARIRQLSLDEVREHYSETFDFDKKCTLYMTYSHYEDGKERGQMLAKLKMLYEMFGLEMPDEELPDFLPLMCEFFYAADWRGDVNAADNFRMPLAIIEDGTYTMHQELVKQDSPYASLIKGLRETLKACTRQEASAQ